MSKAVLMQGNEAAVEGAIAAGERRLLLHHVENLLLYLDLRLFLHLYLLHHSLTGGFDGTVLRTFLVLGTHSDVLVKLVHCLHLVLLLHKLIFLDLGGGELLGLTYFGNFLDLLNLGLLNLLFLLVFLSLLLQLRELHLLHHGDTLGLGLVGLYLPNEETTYDGSSSKQNENRGYVAARSSLTELIGTVFLVLAGEHHVDPFRVSQIDFCHFTFLF